MRIREEEAFLLRGGGEEMMGELQISRQIRWQEVVRGPIFFL
jgi:hypothetical protein